ncbi:MAG: hypothetical protein IJM83_08405 [Firmicutes bacterium]|nr:hypothetical protein [Bacillota bacterium]MBQ7059302.1 hypothetical protein [Bacillota bacterium]
MNWTTIWSQAAAPSFAMGMLQGKKKTVVFPVCSPVSGERVRLRFSNIYGKKPYVIGAVTVRTKGQPVPVLCGGKSSFSIPTGGYTFSDPLELPVAAGDTLEIRLFYASKAQDSNMTLEEAVAYPGDHTMDEILPEVKKESYKQQYNLYDAVVSLDRVEVESEESSKLIVAFGDSITAMNRWIKPLQKRLFKRFGGEYVLLNAGIGGNCLLYRVPGFMGSSYGEKGVARFERDVLGFDGLHTVILALGCNDVAYFSKKTEQTISFEAFTAAVQDLSGRLKERGVRLVVQTLTPREGFVKKGYTPEMEALRVKINAWIRSCGLFDYVFDADHLLRDGKDPSRVDDRYHQGDHLHPNTLGGERMADAYDLLSLTGEEF